MCTGRAKLPYTHSATATEGTQHELNYTLHSLPTFVPKDQFDVLHSGLTYPQRAPSTEHLVQVGDPLTTLFGEINYKPHCDDKVTLSYNLVDCNSTDATLASVIGPNE